MSDQIQLTPLNAGALLFEARRLDQEAGTSEHEDALRAQMIVQLMNRAPSRMAERDIRRKPRRVRGPAVTPRTRVRGPSHIAPLTERSDAEVLCVFDKIRAGLARARHDKRRRLHARNLEAITNELRRRGLWVEVES